MQGELLFPCSFRGVKPITDICGVSRYSFCVSCSLGHGKIKITKKMMAKATYYYFPMRWSFMFIFADGENSLVPCGIMCSVNPMSNAQRLALWNEKKKLRRGIEVDLNLIYPRKI